MKVQIKDIKVDSHTAEAADKIILRAYVIYKISVYYYSSIEGKKLLDEIEEDFTCFTLLCFEKWF